MPKITRRETLAATGKAVAPGAPDGQPDNLWLRWEEKRKRAFEARRSQRIKAAVQAIGVEGVDAEEYFAAQRLAGRSA